MYQASVGQLYELVCSARGVSKEKVSLYWEIDDIHSAVLFREVMVAPCLID